MSSTSRTSLAFLALVLFLPLVLEGCAGKEAGSGDFLVRGRLLDDETGLPVSRSTIYVHAFNDSTGFQVSLEPADSSEFGARVSIAEDGSYSVRVPRRALRLLAINTSRGLEPAELDLTDHEPDELHQDLHLLER